MLAVLFVCVIAAVPAAAQTAVDGFAPQPDNQVFAVAVQPDGRILVGGGFTTIVAQPRAGLARLNADGSLDTTFNPTPDGWVDSLLVLPDGKILVGGHFTTIAGQPRNHLARLNADGSLDATFTADATGAVTTIVRQPDGAIVLGGDFLSVSGTPRTYLARLRPDGSVDPDFVPEPDGVVRGVAAQPNGGLIVVGGFGLMYGQPRQRIARLHADGTLDAAFHPGANNNVFGVSLQLDGKIVISGFFSVVAGQTRHAIARLDVDGSIDPGFAPDVTGRVTAHTVQPDGDIVFGGDFTNVNGVPRQNLARVRPDGSLDMGFNPGADWRSQQIVIQGDGKILVGGGFSVLGGDTRNYLGRLYPDGSLDTTVVTPVDDVLYTMAVQPDDAIVMGGSFTDVGGFTRDRLARLRPDGSVDPIFDPDASWHVYSLAVNPDGTTLVGGNFEGVDAYTYWTLVRLTAAGEVDPTFNPAPDNSVEAILVQPDGRILIAGQFEEVSGLPRSYVTRLNADGSLDASFDPGTGPNGPVTSLALQPDGRVLIGGGFTTVDGQPHARIARLEADGSLDAGFAPEVDASIYSMVLQPDGGILIGGDFQAVNGQPHRGLARLEADGSLDTAYNPDVAGVLYSGALLRDGSMIVGGNFTSVNGQPRSNLARIMADGQVDPDFVADTDNEVRSVTVQHDGKVLVGGTFSTIGGQPRARFARLAMSELAGSRIDLRTDHTTVDWLRSDLAPEVDRAWFEMSTDRSTWTPLVAPERTADGWSLSVLALPRNQTFWLRARGVSSSGQGAQSRSVIESVQQFYLAAYAVTPTVVGGGGVLAPGGTQTVIEGDTSAFTVTPDTGYHLDTISGCGGSLVGTTFTTASIFADCTVTATFAINTYTVTSTAGAHGAIAPAGAQTVNHGDTRAFTVTPDPNYHLDAVSGCGGALVGTTFTTASIVANCTVTATFAIDTYTVTSTAGTHGAIAPAGAQTVNHGDTRAFTVTPDTGYHIDAVSGCGGALAGTTFTTAAIMADCTVTASFAQDEEPTPTIYTRYFAEGAANSFFATRIAVMNPTATETPVTLRLLGANGQEKTLTRTLPGLQRTTFTLNDPANLPDAVFSTVIESEQPVVADRLMTWDATGYGSSLETAMDAPGKTWYLAEGATGGPFSLYYLLQNPGATAAAVEVTYLRPSPLAPITKSYTVEPRSRFTIDVTGEDPGLAAGEVSAKITSDQPIIVERAMYRSAPGQPLGAGHDGAGIAAPQTMWFVVEGATGYFDEYLLIANAESTDATVKATYLIEGAAPFTETLTVNANSRLTIDLKSRPQLAQVIVSVIIESTNAVPVVVERVMWWPHPAWTEASLSAGVSSTGTKWAFAEGELGGPFNSQTYIAIANTDPTRDGTATVTLLYEDGTSEMKTVTLPKQSRTTVDAGEFANAAGKRFGAIIESSGVPIAVERSVYSSSGGVTWSAGAASVATRLTP
jgi:uncharacterized delta-60 repeat protein